MPDVIVSLDDAIARLARARTARRVGTRVVVGIVGAPGSGKSTVAARIADAAGAGVAVVPMDGFHLPNAELDRLGRRDRKGAPDTFAAAEYATLLHGIRAGATLAAPAFDRTIDEPVPAAIAIGVDVDLVIAEGNYLLHDGEWDAVGAALDEAWYVDVDDAVRRARLVARHEAFGRSRAEAEAWVRDVDEVNAAVIAASRARATAVLDNDQPLGAAAAA